MMGFEIVMILGDLKTKRCKRLQSNNIVSPLISSLTQRKRKIGDNWITFHCKL